MPRPSTRPTTVLTNNPCVPARALTRSPRFKQHEKTSITTARSNQGAGRILQWRPYAGRPDHANASDNRCRVQHRTALGNVVAAMTHALQGTIPTWPLRSGVALAAEIESRCARFQHEQNPGAVGGKPNPAFTRRQIFTRPCLHDPLKTPQHQPK